MTDSPHIAALKKQDRLSRLSAARRFRISGGKLEKYAAQQSTADIETVIAAAKEREQAPPQPDETDKGGILLGVWEPKDANGNSLKMKFNVYAAPQDLQQYGNRSVLTYSQTVGLLAATQDFHGFNGAAYKDDTEFYAALRDGSYKGEWIIPPRELLAGTDAIEPSGYRRNIVQSDNLYDRREAQGLKGTFCTRIVHSGLDHPAVYWSSTTHKTGEVWSVQLTDGYEDAYDKNKLRLSCRPVRLELKR